jgi:cytochrome c oxidase subunit 2
MQPILAKIKAALSPRQFLWGAVFAAVAVLIMFMPLPQRQTAPMQRTIRIDASRFQFMPGEIQVNPGDKVTIELVSHDVVHGFSLDNYNFTLRAEPGQTASGTFIASQAGVFRFRCSITCGNLHPFMIGKLSVGTNWLLWRGIALIGLALAAAFFSLRPARSRIAQGSR